MAYLGEEPKFGSFASERFSGNASTTSFTLTHGAASPNSLLVTIDGVKQQTTAYSITDTALDFGSGNAPPTGTNNIEVIYLGTKTLVGGVTDASISTAKIANNAVTGAKIAMGSDAAGDILTYTGTDYVRLAKGTASQTLKMNSGASAVEWATVAAAGDNTPAFEATVGSVQAGITSGAATKVAFNTEVFDVGGNYDHATNYRFVAPETAKYFMYSCNRLVGDGGVGTLYEAYSYFYLNGSDTDYLAYYDFRGPGGNGDSLLSFTVTNTAIMVLSQNDYVEVYANVGTSSSTWTVQNNLGVFFGFKMIGI